MRRYFITGTDTDCGKTYVTRKLLDCIPGSAALKPVSSGCFLGPDGELVNSDAELIGQGSPLILGEINPWRFKAAASPHIAAAKEGVCLSVKELSEYCLNFKKTGVDRLFIEGAGGLMVPLNQEETWIDFLKYSGIPVILVVGIKLGCLNHALLTQACLKAEGIECFGWIANCIDPEMEFLEENCSTLMEKLEFPMLARVPYLGSLSQEVMQCHFVRRTSS